MQLNWLALGGVAGALVAVFVVYHWMWPKGALAKAFGFVVFGILALPGILMGLYYGHWLPEWDWFYEMRSREGSELLMIPVGLFGGLVATLFPTAIRTLFLLGAMVCVCVPAAKPMIGTFDFEDLQDRWRGEAWEVCLQSSTATCGPASACTILNYLGQRYTERELAEESFTYRGGTEAWYLARAIRKRGFEAEFVFRDGFDDDISWPAMVGVKLGEAGHFIPILGQEGGRFRVGDPLEGPQLLDRRQLAEAYEFTGFYLVVRAGS